MKKKNKKKDLRKNSLLYVGGATLVAVGVFLGCNYKYIKYNLTQLKADSSALITSGTRSTELFAEYENPLNKAIQNFSINNYNKSNEVIFFSYAQRVVTDNTELSKLSKSEQTDLKNKLYLTIIDKAKRTNKFAKFKERMYLKQSGHAQTLESRVTAADNDEIWTNGNGFIYKDTSGNYWGGSRGINIINFDEISKTTNPNYKYTIGVSKETELHLDLGMDDINKKVALAIGTSVTVFHKSHFVECASSNYNTSCYNTKNDGLNHGYENRFTISKKIDGVSYSIQGLDVQDGLIYVYLSNTDNKAGAKSYIKVYSLNGTSVGTIGFNGPNFQYEGEGLKIYNNTIFVGFKNKNTREFYIHKIK